MTKVIITLESPAGVLGVFLHHPGNTQPEPLPGVAHSVIRDLPDGLYHVSVAGTGMPPGTPVKIMFATDKPSSSTKSGQASSKGTIALFKPFRLKGEGVS